METSRNLFQRPRLERERLFPKRPSFTLYVSFLSLTFLPFHRTNPVFPLVTFPFSRNPRDSFPPCHRSDDNDDDDNCDSANADDDDAGLVYTWFNADEPSRAVYLTMKSFVNELELTWLKVPLCGLNEFETRKRSQVLFFFLRGYELPRIENSSSWTRWGSSHGGSPLKNRSGGAIKAGAAYLITRRWAKLLRYSFSLLVFLLSQIREQQ